MLVSPPTQEVCGLDKGQLVKLMHRFGCVVWYERCVTMCATYTKLRGSFPHVLRMLETMQCLTLA